MLLEGKIVRDLARRDGGRVAMLWFVVCGCGVGGLVNSFRFRKVFRFKQSWMRFEELGYGCESIARLLSGNVNVGSGRCFRFQSRIL